MITPKRGPGRPIGKRSNPDYKQYTVLIRRTTHEKAIKKLRRIMDPVDFGAYVEVLIMADLLRRR